MGSGRKDTRVKPSKEDDNMGRKIPSLITGMNVDRATFHNEPVEKLSFINFFYGNNGAGKSSIAYAIDGDEGLTWADGRSSDDYDVLVYNRDFVDENFSSYGDLKGVFIVNKVNKAVQAQIDAIKECTCDINEITQNVINNLDLSKYATTEYVTTELSKYVTIENFNNEVTTIVSNYYKTDITNIKNELVTINNTINNYSQQLTQLTNIVTSIIENEIVDLSIEATQSPTFGYFNLPFDVRSKMLFVYFGDQPRFFFPSTETFTSDELANMGFSSASEVPGRVAHKGGKFIRGEENGYVGNAGTIYLNINPAEVKLNGKTWSLVNSQNVESGIKLETPVASSKTLKFGYTRSGAEVGFYEAKATLKPEDISGNTILTLDTEGLLQEAKTAVKNKSKNSILNAGVVFAKSLNNKLQSHAVKVEWEGKDAQGNATNRTVTSSFDIAATAMTPLTIDLLKGLNLPNVPGLGKVQSLIAKIIRQIKIQMPTIPETDIRFGAINKREDGSLAIDVVIDAQEFVGTGSFTVNGGLVYDNAGNVIGSYDSTEGTVRISTTVDLGVEVHEDYTEVINALIDEINSKYTDETNPNSVASQMAELMNAVMEFNNMSQYIEDAKENMIEGLDAYAAKAFDKLNIILGKSVHAFDLALVGRQPYNGKVAVALISKSADMPTKAFGTVTLWPTSYTLELFAPAFKKVVAVTDCFPVGGGASNKALAIQANKGNNMATVISGDQTVSLTGQPGYIYEITYAVVDYHAKEHKVKFYMQF